MPVPVPGAPPGDVVVGYQNPAPGSQPGSTGAPIYGPSPTTLADQANAAAAAASANVALLGATANINTTTAGLQATAFQDQANSEAQALIAGGDLQEAQAYTTAADIASVNEQVSQNATQVQAIQEARNVNITLGQQKADVAASGFQNAGSSLALLRSSVLQGGLTQALTIQQGDLTAGGYFEQQAAAHAESLAASTASAAASSLSASDAAAGVLATTQSVNLAKLAPPSPSSPPSSGGGPSIPLSGRLPDGRMWGVA